MWLSQMIQNAAATVDRAHTADAARFNEREQRALLERAAVADPVEAEVALGVMGTDAEMPMTESQQSFMFYEPRPMWLPADEPFRVRLREVANATRAGVATRPSAAAPIASVSQGSPRRYAVLLIDAEYSGSNWADDVAAEKKAMSAVLKRANRDQLPVFEVTWPDEGFITDASLATLRRPENWVMVEKTTRNAFGGTNLREELRARGITDVVVMGLYQDQCVEATVNSAVAEGLRVHSSASLVQAFPWAEDPTFRGWDGAPDANIVGDIYDLPIFSED